MGWGTHYANIKSHYLLAPAIYLSGVRRSNIGWKGLLTCLSKYWKHLHHLLPQLNAQMPQDLLSVIGAVPPLITLLCKHYDEHTHF